MLPLGRPTLLFRLRPAASPSVLTASLADVAASISTSRISLLGAGSGAADLAALPFLGVAAALGFALGLEAEVGAVLAAMEARRAEDREGVAGAASVEGKGGK